jgi:hypothetical protein
MKYDLSVQYIGRDHIKLTKKHSFSERKTEDYIRYVMTLDWFADHQSDSPGLTN